MSVFCKGCRKTKVNEDFGDKDNGEQYKTCKKCRSKKINKIVEEEIPDCCDAEAIRDTFKQLNCDIVYVKDLKYMMDLDSGIARAIFSGMIKTSNFVIVETITWPNYCFIMNLLTHLGFDVDDIQSYNINIVIYKNSNDAMMRVKSCSANNIFAGFMKCLKLPNKKMCDICNNKKNVLEHALNVKIRCVTNVSKTIIKTMLIRALIVDIIL